MYIMPELLSRFNDLAQHGSNKLSAIMDVVESDVILLDDLSETNLTEAKRENLFLLLNRIELEDRVLIATSNMLPDDLKKFSPQVHSRILSLCTIVPMVGKDQRIS